MKARDVLALVVVAACGPKSAPPATTPVSHDERDEHEHMEHHHHHATAADAGVAETPAAPADAAAEPGPDLVAMETAAWDKARPVFAKYCASCHTTAGKKKSAKKLDHFNMDTYPLGGHHAATIGFTIRDVLGISGKKATMPSDKVGAVKGDDLAVVKAWADAWEAAERAGKHPHDEHGHHDDDDDDDDHAHP